MSGLEGKVALVTGGTSGIGAATAALFVREGARVVLTGRRVAEGEAVARALGPKARFVRADVRSEDDVRAAIAFTAETFGRLDVLFNNAGSLPTAASLVDLDMAAFGDAWALMVASVAAGMKHAAPVMIAQGGGSIVNMASVVGHQAGIGSIAYSTAKAAVLHLTRCAAIELGEHGIRVNSVSPGPVITGIFGKSLGRADDVADRTADDVRAALEAFLPEVQPLPRVASPDDVAHVVAALAGDGFAHVTGHDVVVDGGSLAGRTMRMTRGHLAHFGNALAGG
jgi:NAD(P)-dependent dehydrogenase (short-subunit alcohol dehydrogenase family)